MDTTEAAIKAHADTIRTDIREIAARLNDSLGAVLVAALAGSPNRKASYTWARSNGSMPTIPVIKRLQCAHAQWLLISAADGEQVARMWFIGMNPSLGDISPIEAIAADRFADVASAAREMAGGNGFS